MELERLIESDNKRRFKLLLIGIIVIAVMIAGVAIVGNRLDGTADDDSWIVADPVAIERECRNIPEPAGSELIDATVTKSREKAAVVLSFRTSSNFEEVSLWYRLRFVNRDWRLIADNELTAADKFGMTVTVIRRTKADYEIRCEKSSFQVFD